MADAAEALAPTTNGQVMLLVIYVATVVAWLALEALPLWRRHADTRAAGRRTKARGSTPATVEGGGVGAGTDGAEGKDGGSTISGSEAPAPAAAAPAAAAPAAPGDAAPEAGALTNPPPSSSASGSASDGKAGEAAVAYASASAPYDLEWWRSVLRSLSVFGGIVVVIYLVDGPNGIGHDIPQERVYNRDLFVFIVLVLILIGVLTGRDISGTPRRGAASAAPSVAVTQSHIFNREQSEEWKGVMQTGFVLYHYFAAKETYNLIRLFIAAYVWMTGFGNFSFFWTRKDYSLVRAAKMLVRLNLLVAVVAVALNKEYMLYYVCPLHTSCFLLTYAVMAIGHERNGSRAWVQLKLGAALVLLFVMFDVPGVFEVVWAPLGWLMRYEGSLHEWQFRSTLDHYIIWIGMLCAFVYPSVERWLMATEALLDARRRLATKAALAAVAVAGVAGWIYFCFDMEKRAYNALHPYVSWAPLLGYLILRNLTPYLRQRVRGWG